ncbi:MAG: pknE [Microbacterium sp.]|nr:pknE [Microbacterium sp.]
MASAKGKTNWFAIWVSVAAVVVIVAVGAAVVFINNASSGPGTAPEASSIDRETGAIAIGDGERTLDTYVDFMCPVCGAFETTYGPSIEGLVDDGTITLNVQRRTPKASRTSRSSPSRKRSARPTWRTASPTAPTRSS